VSRFVTGRDATSMWLTPSDGIHAVSPGQPRTPRRWRWGPISPAVLSGDKYKNHAVAEGIGKNENDKSHPEKNKFKIEFVGSGTNTAEA